MIYLITIQLYPILCFKNYSKFDSDCTYYLINANCKCTGDNCSYQNKFINQIQDGFQKTNLGTMNSPLNDKCHYQASLAKCFCRPGDRF